MKNRLERRIASIIWVHTPAGTSQDRIDRAAASIVAEFDKIIKEERLAIKKKMAGIAASFSTKEERSLHPGIPWEKMNESAQIAAHSTAQQIAIEIFMSKDEEEK